MLIPNQDGRYTYEEQRCVHYYAMVDNQHRVIEAFTTEDGIPRVHENYWTDMNDIEKYVCRQRGWNLDKYYPDDPPRGKPFKTYRRKKVNGYKSRFLPTGTYIEEFYIGDSGPYYLGVRIEQYPPRIRTLAVAEGILDQQGNLIETEED